MQPVDLHLTTVTESVRVISKQDKADFIGWQRHSIALVFNNVMKRLRCAFAIN